MPLNHLEVISPAGEIKFYELDPAHGVTNIGRHPDNDVVIDSPSVAPFHAVLYHQQKPYQLIFVGEAQGRTRTLEAQETFQLDGFALIILEAEPAAGPAAGTPTAGVPASGGPTTGSSADLAAPRGPAPVVATPPPPASAPQKPPADAVAGTAAMGAAGAIGAGSLIPNRRDDIVIADFSEREFTLEVEQTATCNVTMINGGDIVATFVISVVGLDDTWVSITPSDMNLNEGQHGSAVVTITPPRRPSSRAGKHNFGIVVSSPDHPERVSQTSATLVIQPYFEFSLSDLSPKQQNIPYNKRAGNAKLSLANTGNSEVKFEVQAADDARACLFEFQVSDDEAPQARQIEVSVPSEVALPIRLSLAPAKRVFFGMQGVSYSYSVQAAAQVSTLSPRSVLGQAQSLPLIGPIHVAIVVILLAALIVMIFKPGINNFTAAPTKVLSSEIMAGKKVSLAWSVSAFTSATIDQGVGLMKDGTGTVDIAPLKTTTYRLTAANLISMLIPPLVTTQDLTVIVDPVEPIVRLTLSKNPVLEGETATVSWEVLNAQEVVLKINGTPETLTAEQYSGRRDVTPKGEMTISIEARNLYTTGNGIVQEKIMEEAKKTFRPEFLNRLTDLIVFRSFTKDDLIQILTLEVNKVLERLKHKNLHLALDDKAKEFLVEKGYDPQYGARPMRRAVERFLEDPLAEEVLRGNLHEGDPIQVTLDKDKLVFIQKAAASEGAVASSTPD